MSFRQSGVRVFGGDLRQGERGRDQGVEALAREVAGVGGGGALAEEDTQADGFGARFLQSLYIAHADEGGEFRAVADDGFGSGGAGLHGGGDDFSCCFF